MTEKSYCAEVCNICGSGEFKRLYHFAEWNLGREPVNNVSIIQCKRCGVRRRMPGLIDDYEGEYHKPYVEQGQAVHPHQLHHFADLMTARLRQLASPRVRFLDIGCSTGRALRLAATLGFTVTGLDYSGWAVEYCRGLGFDVRHGTLTAQWSETALFDVIHCSHTIEHVPDPITYIQEVHRLLVKGGHLMLAFPNYASLPRMILQKRWGVWCLDSHLWQFTAVQMKRILRAEGFRIFSCHTLHGYTPDSELKRKLLNVAAKLGFGDGCNIIAVKT
jgi:2-polyprenyl-3-methyl-5-hydroxy-6-metoxy-1,4-benzoquinol methylase